LPAVVFHSIADRSLQCPSKLAQALDLCGECIDDAMANAFGNVDVLLAVLPPERDFSCDG
jgi:hypothetical protein